MQEYHRPFCYKVCPFCVKQNQVSQRENRTHQALKMSVRNGTLILWYEDVKSNFICSDLESIKQLMFHWLILRPDFGNSTTTRLAWLLLSSGPGFGLISALRRSFNVGITGLKVETPFMVYFTGEEKNLLTHLTRKASEAFPEKATKWIPEADIKLLDHVGNESFKIGWYLFSKTEIFPTNLEWLSWNSEAMMK